MKVKLFYYQRLRDGAYRWRDVLYAVGVIERRDKIGAFNGRGVISRFRKKKRAIKIIMASVFRAFYDAFIAFRSRERFGVLALEKSFVEINEKPVAKDGLVTVLAVYEPYVEFAHAAAQNELV